MDTFPYIGITGFTNFDQVQAMHELFERYRKSSKRRLHVGVMMSRKTLLGQETGWAKVFPPKENIAGIFGSDDVMNCLHYADYGIDPDLRDNLCSAISWGGVGIHAVQLDMTWPDSIEVANAIHISRKRLEVILQVGKVAFEQANNDPQEVVRRLESYEGVIDYVLLDKSVGKGLGMDAQSLLPFARAIRESFPELGMVVAGGLGPDTLDLVKPIVAEFPDVSIDAQGKLCEGGDSHNPIDWDKAAAYLDKALALFG